MLHMNSFVDELVKISNFQAGLESIRPLIEGAWKAGVKHKKPLGLIAGTTGVVLGGQRIGEDVILAERMRAMQRG